MNDKLLFIICRVAANRGGPIRCPFVVDDLVSAGLVQDDGSRVEPTRAGWAKYYAAEGVCA
jgi:hypothetical protein